jgi:dihydrofolate reductase
MSKSVLYMSMSLDGFIMRGGPPECLRAGVLDDLEIHLIPVLLGEGRPLFAGLGAEHVALELTRVIDAPGVTHLHYRVA